eukprot:11225078-Lingulodinium_polyedra.AAC.1
MALGGAATCWRLGSAPSWHGMALRWMVLGGTGGAGACLVANDGRAIPPAKLAGLLARSAGARGGARLRAETG